MTTATATDTTYNGWTNYPTWAVNLWLGNDEGTYNLRRLITRGVMSDEAETSPRYRVAEALREWVTNDLAPDLGATFAADLLGYALGEVNWNEVAVAAIEDLA